MKPSSQPVDQTQRCLSPRPRASAVARPASALLFLLVSHGTICPPEDQVTGLQASAPTPSTHLHMGVTAQRCQPAPHVEARPCPLGSQQAPS